MNPKEMISARSLERKNKRSVSWSNRVCVGRSEQYQIVGLNGCRKYKWFRKKISKLLGERLRELV